jgi:plastocyanin
MKKIATLALMALLSLGLLTACGGGGGATQQLTVEMGEGGQYIFTPAELKVKQGDKVQVKLINKDTANAHSFVIKELNAKSKQVAGGKEETITFTANKKGTFEFFCDVPGHKEGGMVGKIVVE